MEMSIYCVLHILWFAWKWWNQVAQCTHTEIYHVLTLIACVCIVRPDPIIPVFAV